MKKDNSKAKSAAAISAGTLGTIAGGAALYKALKTKKITPKEKEVIVEAIKEQQKPIKKTGEYIYRRAVKQREARKVARRIARNAAGSTGAGWFGGSARSFSESGEIRRKVFSLEQLNDEDRLFSRKADQRRRIDAATTKAAGQVNSASKLESNLSRYAEEINSKHGGDIDKWIESKRGTGAYGKLKGQFGEKAGSRQSLVDALSGKTPDAITNKLASAEKQVEAAADQVVNYGKTRQSVQTASGNTFEAGGKKVNVSAHTAGDVKVKSQAPVIEGSYTAETLSKTSSRRADVVNAQREIPQNNMRIGGNTGKVRSGKIKVQKNPGVVESGRTVVGNATQVTSTSPAGRSVSATITNGQGKINVNAPSKFSKFLKNNKKALLIGGGAALALGTAAGIAASKKKSEKQQKQYSDMEIRRKVFSLLCDESGEERYYSTNEFEISYDENGEKMFSESESKVKKTGRGYGTAMAYNGVIPGAIAVKSGRSAAKKAEKEGKSESEMIDAAGKRGARVAGAMNAVGYGAAAAGVGVAAKKALKNPEVKKSIVEAVAKRSGSEAAAKVAKGLGKPGKIGAAAGLIAAAALAPRAIISSRRGGDAARKNVTKGLVKSHTEKKD